VKGIKIWTFRYRIVAAEKVYLSCWSIIGKAKIGMEN